MLDYFENREDVISQQYSISRDVEYALKDALDNIEAKYKRGHPFANTSFITKQIQETIKKIKAQISAAEARYPDLLINDVLLVQITNLFDGRIGNEYPPKQLEAIYSDLEQRFKLQIPPGYKDRKKEGFKKYGDGVIWYQIIDHAKVQRKPIILIIDDQKEDWWRIEKGQTLGPRPELIAEINKKANTTFYMYNVSQFMKYANKFLALPISQETIDEAKNVEDQKAYNVSDPRRRYFETEDAVYNWLQHSYPSRRIEKSNAMHGPALVLENDLPSATWIEVKYRRKDYFSLSEIGETLRIFLQQKHIQFTKRPYVLDKLMIFFVYESEEDAIIARNKLKNADIDNTVPVIIVFGFIDDNNVFHPLTS